MLQLLIRAVWDIAHNTYTAVLIQAVVSLAYFALLRISEVVQIGNYDRHVLLFNSIELGSQQVSVTFTFYKHSSGQSLNLPTLSHHPPVCPVWLLSHYLHTRRSQKGKLFMLPRCLPSIRTSSYHISVMQWLQQECLITTLWPIPFKLAILVI